MGLYLRTCWAADVFCADKHTVNIKRIGRRVEECVLSPQDEAERRIACRSSGPASAVAKSLVRAMVVNSIATLVPGFQGDVRLINFLTKPDDSASSRRLFAYLYTKSADDSRASHLRTLLARSTATTLCFTA